MRATTLTRSGLGHLVGGALLACAALLTACSGSTPSLNRSITRTSQTPGKSTLPPGMDAPEVRVRLSGPERTGKATVKIEGAWSLEELDGGPVSAGRGLAGELVLSGSHATVAGTQLPRAGAVIVPQQDGDLRIGDRRYPGVLRVARSVDGKHRAYVVMDIETYVAGVVPGEIPAIFPREAQRTQAILARTYAMASIPAGATGAPIVVSDSGSTDQEYHGLPAMPEHRRIASDAATSTRGLVLLDGATPLRAWYHSTCGGHTSPASTVFGVPDRVALSGVKCDWCTSSKYYRWTARLPADAVVRAAGLSGHLEGFSVSGRDAAGRATRLRIQAGGKSKDVDAPAFRLRIGPSKMRSCLLDESEGSSADVVIAGRGWGHGVGLCQIGAKTLAEQSVPADQILRTYYPGTNVVKLW
jgi:stage II sporulation protein D